MNHFLIGFWHVTKSEFYTTSNNQLSGWTQRKLQSTSQSQNCPPKRFMVTVWCLAVGLIHYSFLNPGAAMTYEKFAQQIDEMHWKLQCLLPVLVNRKGPVLLCDSAWLHFAQPVIQKLNELGYKVLPDLPYSPDLSPTDYHFFKHLDRENAFTTIRMQKIFSKCSLNPEVQIFMLQETNLFLIGKNVLIVILFSYFPLIKMCLRLIIMI